MITKAQQMIHGSSADRDDEMQLTKVSLAPSALLHASYR